MNDSLLTGLNNLEDYRAYIELPVSAEQDDVNDIYIKKQKVFEHIVSMHNLNDIKHLIIQLDLSTDIQILSTYTTYSLYRSCECKDNYHRALGATGYKTLLSAAKSNTVDVVKWLLSQITNPLCTIQLQDVRNKIFATMMSDNSFQNIIQYIDDSMYKEIMTGGCNVLSLYHLTDRYHSPKKNDVIQLVEYITNNYSINFISFSKLIVHQSDKWKKFIEMMNDLKYIYFVWDNFLDHATDKEEKEYFTRLNESMILTKTDQKKLLNFVKKHNLKGYLINEILLKKLDIVIIEALVANQVYGEMVGGHIPDNVISVIDNSGNYKMHAWNQCIEEIFIVDNVTYYGDKNVIYKKLKVLDEFNSINTDDRLTTDLPLSIVLTFSINILNKDKVINTMINMILGLYYEKLQFNDIIGLLDLYHKYDGTFIKLESLEYMLINQLMLDEQHVSNAEFENYSGFLIQMIKLYKFRFLFNYLLSEHLLDPVNYCNELINYDLNDQFEANNENDKNNN